MFARYALCNLRTTQIQPVFFFYGRHMCSKGSKDKLISTHQNNNIILKILNYKSNDYLSRYKIPVSQANALLSHREKHGPYKSLQDVLEVEGMTKSILNEFLYSFTQDKQYKKGIRAKKTVLGFKLNNILKEDISTVLGIYIGVNVVTWALLEVKENVVEWNYESISDIPENSSILNLLEMAWQINDKMPKSDIYVMDNTTYDHRIAKSIRHMKLFLEQQQLKAMILAFLKKRSTDAENEFTEKLYLVQHNKVANLYGLRIGNETTSSATLINKLLYRKDNVKNNTQKSPIGVYVSKDILDNYKNQVAYIQDQMNWSLLTALTFLQLGVHQKYDYDFI